MDESGNNNTQKNTFSSKETNADQNGHVTVANSKNMESTAQNAAEEQSTTTNSASEQETTDSSDAAFSLSRVKLYELNESAWDDRGTGHICLFKRQDGAQDVPITPDEFNSHEENAFVPTHFRVICENTQKVILEKPILYSQNAYELQGDSLIVWTDDDSSRDLALSFQESYGCKIVWNAIRRYQGAEQDADRIMIQNKMDEEQADVHSVRLPQVSEDNLHLINAAIQASYKESVAKAILESNYLSQLLKLFDTCEANGQYESLYTLFDIFKNMVLLNDQDLLYELFSEKYVMRVMGVFEYDPDITNRKRSGEQTPSAQKPPRKANHRHYLNHVVVFKKVIPFSRENDAMVTEKIHRAFRIQYLKESILPRCLDDATFNTLNLIICTYHQEISETIYRDPVFLDSLFSKLKDSTSISNEDRLDLIKLLLEYNSLLKNSTLLSKRRAYEKLFELGLLHVLAHTLRDANRFTRQHSSELISSITTFDSSLMRDNILVPYLRTGSSPFFESFLRAIVEDTELGVQENLTETLRLLAEPDHIDRSTVPRFLEMLYTSEFINILLEPLQDTEQVIHKKMSSTKTKESSKQAIVHVLELLSDFIRVHTAKCIPVLIEKNILPNVSQIMITRDKEKDLVLCIIRFFRSCMALCHMKLVSNIIDNNLFGPILKVLQEYYMDNNMLSSSVIEMIEFLHIEAIKTRELVLYIGDKYRSELEHMQDGIPSIGEFLETYTELGKESNEITDDNSSRVTQQTTRSMSPDQSLSGIDMEDSSSSTSSHSLTSTSGGTSSSLPEEEDVKKLRRQSMGESQRLSDDDVNTEDKNGAEQTEGGGDDASKQEPEGKPEEDGSQPVTSFTSVLSNPKLDLNVSREDEQYFSSESNRADTDHVMTHENEVAQISQEIKSKKRSREDNQVENAPEKKRKLNSPPTTAAE